MNRTINGNIKISRLDKLGEMPRHLLLLADPDEGAVDKYINDSAIYVAKLDEIVVGVFVLYPVSLVTVEIKNIAVDERYQRRGIGKRMLKKISSIAKENRYRSIVIGTGNSSVYQLLLYQQQGFEIAGIKFNFFIDNYPSPIFEEGVQCKHMIMLQKDV